MLDEEILEILNEVQHLDWQFHLGGTELKFIQITFDRPDSYTGVMGVGMGRKWLLSEYPTEGEIVFTCWLAIQQILIHEGQENTKYKGERFISPHMPPSSLVELAKTLGV